MKCKLCGSDSKEKLTKLCSNMKIMGPSFPNQDSFVVACKNCGHTYVDTDASQTDFTDYYSSEYSKSLSYYEVFGENNAKIYYSNIEKRIHKYAEYTAEILEIGGGIGELAIFLKNCGYQNITVLEPSQRCIRECEKNGLRTILSDGFSVQDSMLEKYDFIIINHTLEHILDFDKTISSAKKMLKQNGHIYVEVPDAAKYTDVNFVPYWFFTYEHLIHLTLDSFDKIAKAFGLQVEDKKSYFKCESYYVMYAIYSKGKESKLDYNSTTRDAVEKYIKCCEGKLEPILQPYKDTQEPLVLWGVGSSTAQLLNGNFNICNVVKLVDSNPYRQNVVYEISGKKLKIDAPETVNEKDGTILILPLMYKESILRQIENMGLKNKVKSLSE